MSLNTKYTNLTEILEKVRRTFGFEEVFPHDVKEWIWDVIGFMGVPEMLVDRTAEIEVKDWRGMLPVDLYCLTSHQVRDKKSGRILEYSEDTFHQLDKGQSDRKVVQQGSSVTYEDGDRNTDLETTYNSIIFPEYEVSSSKLSYKINEFYIFTNERDITLEISYKAFPMNEDKTEPLIPDDSSVIRAVVWYIGERIAFKLMLADKLSGNKYELIRQEYFFNVGSAITSARIQSVPEFENLKKRALSMWKDPHAFSKGFKS